MRKLVVMLLILCGVPAIASSRQYADPMSPQGPPNSAAQNPSSPQDQPLLQTAEGSLIRVDTQKQMIWIKKLDGKEMQFSYSKETQVEGANNTVEGLTKMTETRLKVQYRPEGGINTAIRIEVQSHNADQASSPGS
jgi:hypothetical protein